MRLRLFHRACAVLLGMFALVHLANHLFALGSFQQHEAFLRLARLVYRHPLVEPLLLAAVAIQVVTGLGMWWRGRARARDGVARIQCLSGLVLLVFLMIHVGAVLSARAGLGLDTNWYFASAGLHVGHLAWFFVPYYGLAVTALCVHAACAAHRRVRAVSSMGAVRLMALAAAGGAVLSACLLAAMAGWLYPVTIPPEYLAPYR